MPPLTPAKVFKVRPSKQGLTRACLGSVEQQDPYPWEDTAASLRGRTLHSAMALLFMAQKWPGTPTQATWAKIQNNPGITPEDFKMLPSVYAVGRNQAPDDPGLIVLTEHPLDLSWMGMDGGKPDLVFVSLLQKLAVIIDWKFGKGQVDDPRDNAQMQDYGAGIIAYVKAKYAVTLESVELVVIQPYGANMDDWYRSHTFTTAEIKAFAAQDQATAQQARIPGQPRVAGRWCDQHFCSARKDGVALDGTPIPACTAYAGMKADKAEQKQAVETAQLATVTKGTPIVAEPDQGTIIPEMPVVVISAEVVAECEAMRTQALSIKVADQGTLALAGRLSKEIRAKTALIDKNRKGLSSFFHTMWKRTIAAAEPAMSALEAAAAYLDTQADAYVNEQNKIAEAQRAEEARKIREAEEAAEAARVAEARKAEEARLSAQRAIEAQKRADEAKGAAARKKAQAEADEALRLSQEQARQAQEEETKRLQADRDARVATAAKENVAGPTAVAGFKPVEVAYSTIPDLTKIPKGWMQTLLVVDQKQVDALVKSGKLNETNGKGWLVIERKMETKRTR